MKLVKLLAGHYRSLRDVTVGMKELNVFIGANASGKSNVLDALRFLHEGVRDRDFGAAMRARGGILHLPWKGEEAQETELGVEIAHGDDRYGWWLRFVRDGYEFHVEEQVLRHSPQSPPAVLLDVGGGIGWWWSGEEGERVEVKQASTGCALAAASADASFPGRDVAEFVRRWGFFDPHPFLLRRDWAVMDAGSFDAYGRNLGETLHSLQKTAPDVFKRIVDATEDVLGLPSKIEPRESDDRFYFVQREPGLQFPVHQIGVSSGTLRMLALMTALFADPETKLIGIEEPENYVHPTALQSFVEYLRRGRDRVQFIVTTHSPLLLDYLDDPGAVRIVRRTDDGATTVDEPGDKENIRTALQQSGFSLGEFYETQGFGAN